MKQHDRCLKTLSALGACLVFVLAGPMVRGATPKPVEPSDVTAREVSANPNRLAGKDQVTNEFQYYSGGSTNGSSTDTVAPLAVQASGSCCAAPAGLVGWWPGDGDARDLAGTHTGTLQAGASASAPGLVNSAFQFDGNSYVQIPDSPELRPAVFTIETWVRFDSLDSAGTASAGQQYLIFKQNTRHAGFEGFSLHKARTANGDFFTFGVSSAAGQYVRVISTTPIVIGVWYHVAGVRSANALQLFVNGQPERQASVSFAQDYGNYPLYLGSSGQAYWDRKLKGSLDEVGLYNRALLAEEIAAIYAAGAAGKCKGPQAPSIVVQPQSQQVAAGAQVSLSVTASGTLPLAYQWRCNGVDLVNGGQYGGVTSPTLFITNVQPGNAGDYSVWVTNVAGAVTSAVAALVVNPPGSCLSPPEGLIGWWPGDGNANDITGTNHGTLQGGASASVPGLVGSAFCFDGTNGYVRIADAPELKPTNLTVECWVKFNNLDAPGTSVYPGQQYLVFKQNTRARDFEAYVLSKDRTVGDIILWEVTSGAGQLVRIDSVSRVTTNEWYHLAGVRGSNYIQLYFNGRLEAQTNVSFPQNYGNWPLYFGTSGQAYYDRKLNGLLDEVALYNRALSASEIAALYAAGPHGKCKSVSQSEFGNSAAAAFSGRLVLPVVLDNKFCFTLLGATGGVYRVEVSTDLVHWSAVKTVTLRDGAAQLGAPNNGQPQFYRARLLPDQ